MLVNTAVLVLSTVKYGESDIIAKLFTRELGVQSYMIKGVRKSRKGKLRISFFQPLTQLEIQTNHKGKGNLEYIKEARVRVPYSNIHTDIVKGSIALFFSEVLSQLLINDQPDESLFDYLNYAFEFLDVTDHVANFSIKVLLDTSVIMGFGIDQASNDQPYLNLLTGVFDDNGLQPHHTTQSEASLIKQFMGIKFDELGTIKMNRSSRNSLLSLVIDYFQIHLQVFKKPSSLAILKQLFDS
ncbi:DNA repair protein RecO [Nonlabens sp. SCSIO 43208]|uniref:DNA repair protein RecO n=1 Tax=Nonlabens sp. SCSIO 43208 TaxID=2793009 RepID=UPI003D6A99DE